MVLEEGHDLNVHFGQSIEDSSPLNHLDYIFEDPFLSRREEFLLSPIFELPQNAIKVDVSKGHDHVADLDKMVYEAHHTQRIRSLSCTTFGNTSPAVVAPWMLDGKSLERSKCVDDQNIAEATLSTTRKRSQVEFHMVPEADNQGSPEKTTNIDPFSLPDLFPLIYGRNQLESLPESPNHPILPKTSNYNYAISQPGESGSIGSYDSGVYFRHRSIAIATAEHRSSTRTEAHQHHHSIIGRIKKRHRSNSVPFNRLTTGVSNMDTLDRLLVSVREQINVAAWTRDLQEFIGEYPMTKRSFEYDLQPKMERLLSEHGKEKEVLNLSSSPRRPCWAILEKQLGAIFPPSTFPLPTDATTTDERGTLGIHESITVHTIYIVFDYDREILSVKAVCSSAIFTADTGIGSEESQMDQYDQNGNLTNKYSADSLEVFLRSAGEDLSSANSYFDALISDQDVPLEISSDTPSH